ncbi:hypothetical protein BO85DRAFT_431963 [Aspergillus piperis CBS 112811]|uniref:Uncharacterized protein n=1 Tax=Aspergillus piperis CBS 112811 TaxID=1448313 RepID=A0A8G1QTI3_9EURO|nr:hypothetical protein BO85DRAFT_431963 [Aspergillus piperis CBS 112811]RAH52304.1 hypothetical protein BO85DRAFT_431963 [Aspergillus piperis CBS 112811]
MKPTSAFATIALTFAVSVNAAATGYCDPGLNYCSSVLNDVGNNDSAIRDALKSHGNDFAAKAPALWSNFLFHCNDDRSLTVVESCVGFCQNNGVGNSDTCSNQGPWI